jgi:hypothetical protein
VLRAPVPRNLRVRSSIQLSSTRVPARAFLSVAGLVFGGGLLIVAGAELMGTVRLTAALSITSLVIFELRCWGRSMPEVAHILARHYRRPQQLRPMPVMMVISAESAISVARRPRWQTES